MCYEGLPFLRVACGSFDGLRNYCGLRDCIDYAKFFLKIQKVASRSSKCCVLKNAKRLNICIL